ncbi:MAG: xanthine dehydrogenase family protein subunit M [Anaerolineae bacterium]|nr:xanthine dehydrogenase family protein subunit M [Anaerolineae bacterium]
MRPFAYLEPATLTEAVAMLAQHQGQAHLLAGGTDLLVEIKEQVRRPETVINLKKIAGLDQLQFDPAGGLRLGALVTARQVETSPVVQRHYAGLAQDVRELGSMQIRNRATVAGNICRASPSADTPPPLIAAGARLRLVGPAGAREVLLESFFSGPGQTVLAPGEIVTEIVVPAPPPHTAQVYLKHGRRRAMELATVGVAVWLTMAGEVCQTVRLVLGAVAPTPLRVQAAEAVLTGHPLTDALIAQAADIAMQTARPIDDVRASAAYRREMVGVLTRRAMRQAVEEAS